MGDHEKPPEQLSAFIPAKLDEVAPVAKITPESAKIHPLVEFLCREWRVLKSVSFYIAVAVVGIGIFWLQERHYSQTIIAKDAAIGTKEATITEILNERDFGNRENDKLSKQIEECKCRSSLLKLSDPSGTVRGIVASNRLADQPTRATRSLSA